MKLNFQCSISFAFLFTSFYMMISSKKDKFKNSLGNKYLKIYSKVVDERRKIWYLSTVIGILVTYVYHINFSIGENAKFLACSNTLVFFLVQYFVYNLHPKKNWMLDHISEKKDIKNWLKMYKKMKKNWHIGLVLGLFGYLFINYNILKYKKN